MKKGAKIVVCWGLAYAIAFAFPLLSTEKEKQDLAGSDHCLTCHVELEVLPQDFKDDDVHTQSRLSCAGCHGGDPTSDDEEEAMSAKKGFVGVPSKSDIPEFCGKCHSSINFMRQFQPRIPTDQIQQYATSVHGKRLQGGDKKVADCVSCHTAHGIRSTNDSRSTVYPLNVPSTCNECHGDPGYMSDYSIPTDQYDEYSKSVHGVALLENQDIGSPACNDCHGNHGAMPPGITSIRQVCGSCHINNINYFSASVMGKAFDELDLHGCEECHGYHDVQKTYDDMLGVGEKSVCIPCHDVGDAGYDSAIELRRKLEELKNAYALASAKQVEVHRIGMDDVDIVFLLQESHQSLVHARTLIHTFDVDRLAPEIYKGVSSARKALALAVEQVEDFQTRRRGFGIATIFITILLVALFLKIRQIEAR